VRIAASNGTWEDRQPAIMDPQQLRTLCLTLRGSRETFPFGAETSVFRVFEKIFALSSLRAERLTVSVKCEPLLAEHLRTQHPAITAGYHLNKRHWNTIAIDGSLADRMIADMVEDSYDLIVSQLSAGRRRGLGWRGDDPRE
jgi:predicted DNA-binding protein (MmcQ/YjbR family)